jgi:transcriptional regulator with XRE-family HTH domain
MNLVGPRVRRIRWERKLRQKDLAAKLQIAGWPLDRAGVSKIESGFIKVSDRQLLYLMHVLKVDAHELLPAIDPKKPIDEQIRKFMKSKS